MHLGGYISITLSMIEISVVKKKNEKYRLIGDFKYTLDEDVRKIHHGWWNTMKKRGAYGNEK